MLFAFGLIQVLIGLRFLLVLVGSRRDNTLVDAIIGASDPFVAPFQGILPTDIYASGSALVDQAAIAALIGWTILELMLYWAIGLLRRETA